MNKLIFLLAFILVGCNAQEQTTMSKAPSIDVSQPKLASSVIPFTGKVIYVELEGGFWAVVTEQGKKLNGGLPNDLQLHNQGVSGYYQLNTGMMSFQQWGELVIFSELKAVGKPGIKPNSM